MVSFYLRTYSSEQSGSCTCFFLVMIIYNFVPFESERAGRRQLGSGCVRFRRAKLYAQMNANLRDESN